MNSVEIVGMSPASLAGSRFRVELLSRSVEVRDALLSGLRSLDYEVLEANDERPDLHSARVRIIEEGLAPPPDAAPFVVIAPTGSVEGFASAIGSGASGYFILPLEFLSLGAALCAAASGRSGMSGQQTVRSPDGLTADQTINTVVGILMERFRTQRIDAYARLRRHSRQQRRKLVDVAAEFMAANENLTRTLRSIESVPFD